MIPNTYVKFNTTVHGLTSYGVAGPDLNVIETVAFLKKYQA